MFLYSDRFCKLEFPALQELNCPFIFTMYGLRKIKHPVKNEIKHGYLLFNDPYKIQTNDIESEFI